MFIQLLISFGELKDTEITYIIISPIVLPTYIGYRAFLEVTGLAI